MAATEADLIELAETYFAAVDAKDMAGALRWLAPDCVFTIETGQVTHQGRDTGIQGMFERLFERYAEIWHGDFRHTIDAANGRIASQFNVRNTEPSGTVHTKRNCNFFTVENGLFTRISVYMSGENTLV